MCGIAGFWGHDARSRTVRMTRLLEHRGPDDEGLWQCPRTPLALGNRRLRIIDLSSRASQPMVSPESGDSLTFNGEIYNYRELRGSLESVGEGFATNSDTEVLLRAMSIWGREALRRVEGMFAFAFWSEE